MTTVLVIGASKGIGLETVKAGLAAGFFVRALARSAGNIGLENARLSKIAASALDSNAMAKAIAGADVVVMSLGVTRFFEKVTLFSDATRVVIDAMRKANVRRLLVVTGMGAGDSRGHGGFIYDKIVFPILLKRAYDDKDIQEMMVRQSGLDWTIARPGALTNGPAKGTCRALPDKKDWGPGSISRADVAAYLISEIVTPRHIGKTPELIN